MNIASKCHEDIMAYNQADNALVLIKANKVWSDA